MSSWVEGTQGDTQHFPYRLGLIGSFFIWLTSFGNSKQAPAYVWVKGRLWYYLHTPIYAREKWQGKLSKCVAKSLWTSCVLCALLGKVSKATPLPRFGRSNDFTCKRQGLFVRLGPLLANCALMQPVCGIPQWGGALQRIIPICEWYLRKAWVSRLHHPVGACSASYSNLRRHGWRCDGYKSHPFSSLRRPWMPVFQDPSIPPA